MGFGDNLKKLVTQAADGLSKLQEMSEQQKERQSQKEIEDERERQAEIRSLPTAQAQLTASGWATGQWSGQVHYGWNEIGPGEPEPEDKDPYATKKLLWFELFAADGEEPVLGGHKLTHWSFQLAGWDGDGVYDLAAICREREAAGWASDYLEWEIAFADSDDSTFYFTSDTGPAVVTVTEGGKHFSVSISATGAIGDLTLAGEITRP
jgi:hypothetical protein